MTHALQVLHTLQWHHPGWRALLELAQAPTEDYHSYTHTLLGRVGGEVTSPSGSPMKWQANTELLSICGHTGTPQRVSLPGLGGKECSWGKHSAYVDGVGLLVLPQAEGELFVCVISALFQQGRKKGNAAAPITVTFPPVKQRQRTEVCG